MSGSRLWALGFGLLLTAMAPNAHAQTRLIIISGLGGAPKYTQEFAALSTALAKAARERAGLPDSTIAWYGDPAAPKSVWYRGPSMRDTLETAFDKLASRPANEQVLIVLIGHGSGEGADTKISLPGPDLTARDFSRILGRFGARRVAFVNLTSASGDMLDLLKAPGRVVITATKSAFERNESVFGTYFIDAFAKDGADTDKDNRVSVAEAFTYAARETDRMYENESKMATEHAQIADDSGVGNQFFLTPGALGRGAGSDMRLAALYNDRFALDKQIQALKAKKKSMSEDAFYGELEPLMVSLAQKAREIRQMEKAP